MAYAMVLYRVTTTFLGASGSSEFYFDTMEKAQAFREKECQNGEIAQLLAMRNGVGGINYSDECSLCQLTYGDFELDFIEIKGTVDYEFECSKESVGLLLNAGAAYIMSDMPQVGVKLLAWRSVPAKLKKRFNLNNCPYITTADRFELNGISLNPVASLSPQERYDKANTRTVSLKLNRKTDADILEWLDKQPSKQGAIKEAIKQMITKEVR